MERAHLTPLAPTTANGDAAEEVSFVALVNMLLRSRWLLLLLPLSLGFFAGLLALLSDRTYTATASFVPQNTSQSRLGSLAGVAAQFGLAVPSESPAEYPALYAHLLGSQVLLDPVVRSRYVSSGAGRREERELTEFLVEEPAPPELARDQALRKLRNLLQTSLDNETGLVTFSVRTESPQVSAFIARRLLEEINTFNLGRRRAAADAQREFAEERVAQARTELRVAETALQRFLSRNRLITNSPQLEFERERLGREVAMRQEIYTGLAQSYEQARIEAVRDIPVITVIEQPRVPVRPDARGTVRRTGLAILAGLVIALLIALARELMRRGRVLSTDDLREYEMLRGAALADLRHPVRGITRLVRPRPSGSGSS
jgi:uncharacterized protein involved in exopolysaccharide biosynthesis